MDELNTRVNLGKLYVDNTEQIAEYIEKGKRFHMFINKVYDEDGEHMHLSIEAADGSCTTIHVDMNRQKALLISDSLKRIAKF